MSNKEITIKAGAQFYNFMHIKRNLEIDKHCNKHITLCLGRRSAYLRNWASGGLQVVDCCKVSEEDETGWKL